VLGSAALGVAAIGAIYLIAPQAFLAALGRFVSMIVDGWPHPLIVAVFGVELAYFCGATFLVRHGATPA